MTISKELLDELLSGVERPEDLLGDKGLMQELKVRLMERMLGAELTDHLGYEPHGEPASQQINRRNGATRKVLKGNDGAVPIDIPRDRDGSFEPELIRKGQTRIDGMDDKIIGRCCQTNANQSLNGQWRFALCRTELAPLSESGGAVKLEIGA
jgi:putative transposase